MSDNSGLTGLEIAVIGMSGRFPGARNIDEFWENLKNGIESIHFFSDEELLQAGVDPGLLENPDYVKSPGGKLEDVEYFDAAFFGYSPNEAAVMNPQARIFHECVWEALEQAGYDPGTYTGKIGLYAGASSSTAWESLVTWSGKADEVGRFAAVSLADSNFLCTRIAYKFNLRGPVYAIQSACSTSLTAIDLACRSILTGMCNMALAGGVSLKDIRKTRGYLFKEGMIRSPDGHCRAFDAEAKGIAGGEGAGVVLLKLLDEALTDGDNIHAIVKGSASNNDGSRKVGYTAPSIEGQAEVIRAAHLAAEIDPETVTYVETHGTGTSLGDPVEIEALKQGFGTNKKGFCFIGSVKTNIGHLDTAAGVTGFIKTVLALEHRLIPPSLNFKTPNPKIDFENSPFCINTILKEWPRGNFPLRAGVSAFGIGGTNAHVVLEEWPQNTPRTEKTAKPTQSAYYLIPLSARTGTALDKMSANLCAFLQEHKEYIDPGDVAYTLQVGRKRFHQRRILICSGIAEAIKEFSSTTSNKTLSFNAFEKAPAVIFMFPGQGSQYVGMALDLYRSEPIFRQEMDRCFAILKSLMDYDLKEILYPSLKNNPITGDLLINETEITQPVIFTIEYALTKLLMTWGIKPYAMIGHSIGEYTAACIAGVFSLENALKIVTMRGKLMQQVPHGAMTGVAISEKQLLPLLEAYPNIALAAVNSPANCTVSGAQQDIAVFEEQAKENGFRIRPLHTSHAFHSRMMDPILETFAGTFKHVQVNKPVIPYLSNLSGTWISTEQIQDPTYWSKHLRQAVRFSDGLQELLKIENTIFIEVGPGRVLSTFVKEHETGKNGKTAPQVINLVKHPQEEIPGLYFLYREIGKLWLYGKELDWQAFRREEQGRRIPLPAYPFERQHFHIERNAQLVSNMAGGAADRFYLPRWKRTPPVYKNKTDNISENKKNQWLVFMDKVGFGAALVKHLENRGDEVITVMAGETIQPQNPEDYLKFFKSLNREGRLPDRVIHLWTLSGPDRLAVEDLLDLGFYSLLNIAKAIRKNSQHSPGSGQQFRLYVISDHWWDVTGEEIIEPAKAVMAGPLAVIPQEHPNIRCRAIDIVYRGQQEHHLVERITAEMLNDRGEAAAAFRGPYRLTRDFEPLHLDAVKPGQLPLQEKGIYLITGGLGKIGFNLASWLAKDYQARLILTGRSGGGHDAETIKKIKELESLGAEVMVCQADVRDRRQMQNITAAAQERWGEIQGVIHAAGILKGKSFNTVENLQPADCLQQFQAKVYGTQVLEELLADKKLDFCLLISSISTILGGLQFAAYAGANAFMDAFASQQKRDNHFYWLSVAWDHMPARETIEAFKRILALPISEINSVAVSGTGNLQARIDRWINLEFTGEDNKTASEDTNGLNAQSQHPRPQLCTPFAAPAGKTQEALAQTWKRLFGFDQIGIHDDFLELGGDSLKAVTVIAAIHKALNVEVPLPVFFSNPTIEKLAEYIDNTKNVHKTSYHAVTPVEKKEYYSLSSAQERLYFLQQLDLKSVSYHMPFVYPLPKEINKEKLELTLKHLIARHESLRTSFIVVHEEVVQRIHQNVDFAIEYYDLTAEETKVFGSPPLRPPEAFIRPFDLSRAPLIRSGIMKLPGDRWLWLLDMHHIISDGTSHSILTEDFSALYEDLVLEPLLLQYKDYAQWQNNMLKSGKINAQEEYWIKLFAGEIPRLKMPADNKRPAVFTFAGDRFGFYLSPENSADFKALGAVNGGTLYMNLLAAVNTLFFKYTGQTDIIIGCGIAGRPHADLQRIVGMFINTLAMRNYPGGEKTYQLFLKEVIAQSIEAFENQDVPFEELVARLALDRDPSCNPLFDITMVLQNFRQTKVVTTNAEVVPDQEIPYRNSTSKFDMTIFVHERDEGVHIVIEYYTAIFKLSTIQRFAAHFTNVIKSVIREPGILLQDIEILTPGEKEQILYDFNNTNSEFPGAMTLPRLFEEQVEQSKDAAVLVDEERVISYGNLNAMANRLARYLCREKGIKPGDRVAIWMSPSLERVMAILGVLKAGAVYVPIDPALPLGRIEFMIKESVTGVVLSEKRYIHDLDRLQWECSAFHTYLCLDSFSVHDETENEKNELMDKDLWRHVGETALDDITAGGWLSSYTGKPFSKQEMDEYGDNILTKLIPILHPRMKVLEIGCASGISMYRIAGRVGSYYGTDLSAAVIDQGKKKLIQLGIQNIKLSCLEAHDIDRLGENDFDLIIINSVIQCFHGYNYLRRVIEKGIKLLSENGYIFIGDVMDLDKKKAMVQELMEFKSSHKGKEKEYTTKTDFSAELFVSRGFWLDLQTELHDIEMVDFSPKIYTIENELTKFRYDVLFKINKKVSPQKATAKIKFQEDLRALETIENVSLNLPIESINPAYIIYTSGTTGKPKGVIIEHKSVVNFIFSMYRDYEKNFGPADHCLALTNYCFDVSVCEIFMPLVFGASIVLLPYEKYLEPGLVGDIIIKKSITFAYIPPGLLQEIVNYIGVQLKRLATRLELNKLLVGVEPIKDNVLEAYLKLNPAMKIINGYGPTEATICASAYSYTSHEPEEKQIPIGRPLANMNVLLLDTYNHLVPVGVPGEICIAGIGLARGYLNRPELTAERFIFTRVAFEKAPLDPPKLLIIHHSPFTTHHSPLYKTGDLAKWLPDGNIMFIGRMDHQVKVRGFRIELGEIENVLQKHEGVRAAVVTVEAEGGYLCAYITADKKIIDSQLKEYLEELLPDYMIPSYFIQLDKLPLTPNGKIDRKALPVPGFKVDENYAPPTNEIEKKLTVIWSEILGIKEEIIGIDGGFFTLGGHSLKATILTSRVHKELNVLLPLVEIFKTPTVRGLATYIKNMTRQNYIGIEPVEKKEYYPLSSAQKRLFILQQMEPGNVSYNMPTVIPITDNIDIEKFELIFKQLIARHESLRTSFEMIGNEPVQRVWDKVEFKINKSFAPPGGGTLKEKSDIKPFNLSIAPLVRLSVKQDSTLCIDMHHIISDGVSLSILKEEFEALSKGQALAPLKLQYKDYSYWQNSRKQQELLAEQEKYWLREFEGELPVLHLPLDFARPQVQSFSGNTVDFVIDSVFLKGLAAQANVSLFMVILAVFNILLSKLSGQEDIIIGTPVAGRRHADLERIIGMFVNTLPLRNYPVAHKPFLGFLEEIKERTLAVFENQEYPFEDLVDKLSVPRDTGHNPVFDVVFNLLNQQDYDSNVENIDNWKKGKHKASVAKFDITLTALESGEHIFFAIEYCRRLFEAKTIDRVIEYFKYIVEQLVSEPKQPISELEIITKAERRQILHDFNNTTTAYPGDKTIPQLFGELVNKIPDRIAVVVETLRATSLQITYFHTYFQLNQLSDLLAGLLIEKGVLPDNIVGIKIERSVEMIIGILGILKSGGAYLPIDPRYPQERIDYMLKDSNAAILLTDEKEINCQCSIVNSQLSMRISHPLRGLHHSSFSIHHSNLSYLIYTSGSTGKPKGVPVTHGNLSPLLHWGDRQMGIGSKDRFLQNLAYHFDWSVWEIVMGLTTGASLYLVANEMLLDPMACIPFMEKHDITVLHATPGQYRYFVGSGLKLKSLKYLFLGAEKLTFELLKRAFDSVNENCRIFNMYGPTECTIISAVLEIDRSQVDLFTTRGVSSVPIGTAVGNTCLLVLDNYEKLCPVNVVGELYIGGAGVACGYINNPELTANRFKRNVISQRSFVNGKFQTDNNSLNPTNDQCPMTNDYFYSTGDLVRWLFNGGVEFLGRIDHQVKVRGFRIELGEIESALNRYVGIKEAVVLVREENLCGYIVSDSEISTVDLWEYLSGNLPDYMIPANFVQVERFPLTPNGKIDFKALPEPGFKVRDNYVSPRNVMEEKMVQVWSEVLGVEKEIIGIDANFFQLGGHSLKATVLASRVHKELGLLLPLTEIFKAPKVRGLAAYINGVERESYTRIEPVEKKEYYQLSSAQKRLFILQQMEPDNVSYNMPTVIPLVGDIDIERFELIFKQLIARHESLRTSFEMVENEPVQRVWDKVEFKINKSFAPPGGGALKEKGDTQPFNLSYAPLLRVSVRQDSTLCVDMHHIISDGISLSILKEEFEALSKGQALAPLKLQYKDYSYWQNSVERREFIKQQERYWLGEFSGELPVLHLPLDFVRPPVQSFSGNTVDFVIDSVVLKGLAAQANASLFMVILAVFNVLLSKLSGQEDIIIGTPVAGRRQADLEQIIGMFVNTLPLRNYSVVEKPFLVFLEEIKERTLAVFENQEYPFEGLVDKLSVPRDTGRNPIFDVVFNLLNHQEYNPVSLENTKVTRNINKHKSGVAKFDLTLTAVELGENLFFTIEYSTQLFKPETIDRIIEYFKHIIEQLAVDPEQRISELEIITEVERQKILYDFNNTITAYPIDKTIPQLFAEQVEKVPNSIAIVFSHGRHRRTRTNTDNNITYFQLNQQSDYLAALLIEKGVLPDNIVGIKIERSVEMIIGILGILKSGGAYLPIDLTYPQERIDYMLKDSNAKLTINYEFLKEAPQAPLLHHSAFIIQHFNSSHLAYLIYTSGSTGKPKGVMVDHYNVIRVVRNTNYIELNPHDRILQLSNYAFDGSIFDIFGALLNGASLVMISREDVLAVNRLSEIIQKECITVFFVTSALFNTLVDLKIECLSRIRKVLLGGERISVEHSQKALNYLGKGKIINAYGPTETTVFAGYYPIDNIENGCLTIPIGKPLSNTTIYILDKNLKPMPVGIPGEIFIGGTGVARGYLNNPELTADRFKRNVISQWSFVNGKFQTDNNPLNLTNDQCQMTNDYFYRTGDLGRWLPDGNIEFLDRLDHQVKIRGFRIELGEIESRLLNHPGIKETIVLVHEEEQGDKYICAYFVSDQEYSLTELHEFMSKQLPDYMIPSYFIHLEKIPLTPNGKIDRKALPKPGLKAAQDYAAPRNKIETQLVSLWSELLNIKPDIISIDANFFRLGGHSLKATVLLVKIQKEFNVNIPLGTIFYAPTIRLLAEYINCEEKIQVPIDDDLILLKKSPGSRNNLFFIHDGSGEVEGYLEFCSCLGTDFPFNCLGIRAKWWNNEAPQDVTIEEIAGRYIKKIKTIQPTGPFYVMGWSFGGTIAFEITRQLETLNEKVKFLAMIDVVAPFNKMGQRPNTPCTDPEKELDFIRNLPGGETFLKELPGITGIENTWPAFVRFLETQPGEAQRIKALAAQSEGLIIPNLDFLNIGEVIRFFNMTRSFIKARAFYMPAAKIAAPVHYFRPTQSQVKNAKQWNHFAHNKMSIYDVAGDHYSIFKPPHAADFAAAFNKVLKRIKEDDR